MSPSQTLDNTLATVTGLIKLVPAVVFGAFCMTVGGIIMTLTVSDLIDAHASRHWQSTVATLDQARAVRNTGRGSHGYAQEIRYHFSVAGIRYEGSRLSFNRRSTKTSEESMAMLPSTATGSAMTIYFDPKDPVRNVVYPGVEKMMFIPPLFSLVSVLVGAVVGGLQVRRFMQQKRRKNM